MNAWTWGWGFGPGRAPSARSQAGERSGRPLYGLRSRSENPNNSVDSTSFHPPPRLVEVRPGTRRLSIPTALASPGGRARQSYEVSDCGPAGWAVGRMKMALWSAARHCPLGSRLWALMFLCFSSRRQKKKKGLLIKGLPLLGGKNGKRSPGSCPGAHCGLGLGARLTGGQGYWCVEPGWKGKRVEKSYQQESS